MSVKELRLQTGLSQSKFANMFDISWLFQGLEEFDKTVIRNMIFLLRH